MNRFAPSTAPAAFTANATERDIADRLRKAGRIVVLTHAKPDGDAVGSSLALTRTLQHLGKTATPVFFPPWPSRMDPIVGATPLIHARHGMWDDPALQDIDTVAVVDTGSWTQVADARPWLEPRAAQAVIIDHHAHGDPEMAPLRLIDVSAAAAAQIVARVSRELLGLRSFSELPLEVAEPLYLGLATDTGWFRHANVTADVLRLAADLIDAGVDQNRLYRQIEQNDSPNRLALIQRALAGMQLSANNRVAVITITLADAAASEASQDELGGLADLPQTIGSVRAAAVLTELEPQLVKVSLRSKAAEPGQQWVDVNAVAKQFGGGGHVHAAGAKIRLPLAEAREKVTKALVDALS